MKAARELVARAQDSGVDDAELRQAIRDAFKHVDGAHREEVQHALDALAPALTATDDDRALAIGMLCGALVEAGAAPADIEQPLLERFGRIAASARKFHAACVEQLSGDDDAGDPDAAFSAAAERVAPILPAEYAAYLRLGRSFAPAIVVLSATPSARRRGREMATDLEAMSENLGAHWISKILAVLDDEPYVAIEPDTRKGIRGRMSGISENFQLNALLMDVFPRPPRTPPRISKPAAQTARGRGPQQLAESITGAWNLLAWPSASGGNEQEHWIWNEGTPADIPTFEGARVILLGPPSYVRTWNAQRDFAALQAELTIEERLPEDDVRARLKRMAGRR